MKKTNGVWEPYDETRIVGGILICWLTRLLFTPQSGRVTQEQLREYVNEGTGIFEISKGNTVTTYQDLVLFVRKSMEASHSNVPEIFQAGREETHKTREPV
ncbi:MAG: hypothetical protein H0W49_11260 [Nitrospirales bacterium]|nr:hypothetical protein [Nitrospirales bacterium]